MTRPDSRWFGPKWRCRPLAQALPGASSRIYGLEPRATDRAYHKVDQADLENLTDQVDRDLEDLEAQADKADQVDQEALKDLENLVNPDREDRVIFSLRQFPVATWKLVCARYSKHLRTRIYLSLSMATAGTRRTF